MVNPAEEANDPTEATGPEAEWLCEVCEVLSTWYAAPSSRLRWLTRADNVVVGNIGKTFFFVAVDIPGVGWG
jgi:hypothetical protein